RPPARRRAPRGGLCGVGDAPRPPSPLRARARRAPGRSPQVPSRRRAERREGGRGMTNARRPRRPLVSVVVPIHDRFAIARRALDSVYAQSHRPVEAIVVDDASSPPFAPPPVGDSKGVEVRVRRIEDNVGPGGAREAGRRLATGEFIAYLDSDDAWRPEHLSSLVELLERRPEADMAWAPTIEMHEGDERVLRRYNDEAHERILPALLWGRP